MKLNTLTAATLALLAISLAAPADAGGLFGKRGLIRGSVGAFLDSHIDRPLRHVLRPNHSINRHVGARSSHGSAQRHAATGRNGMDGFARLEH